MAMQQYSNIGLVIICISFFLLLLNIMINIEIINMLLDEHILKLTILYPTQAVLDNVKADQEPCPGTSHLIP